MFKDLKILELASVLAGPSVGQFFAELGADVIKLENLKAGGDVTRTWKIKGEETDDRSAYFCAVNWGKRSIAIDLESTQGGTVVRELVKRSDIVIASYKPGDAEKLRVDYNSLVSINPNIIYGSITGYGARNKRVGYDAIIQAEAGFMFMNGVPSGPSLKIPVALMDVLAAHHLKEGLLLALLQKIRTGKGGLLVEVSLIECAISSLVNQATNWLVGGKLPLKQGSSHPNIAPYGDTFTTKDEKEILLAIGNDRQFQDLCRILGLDDKASHPDFITNSARVLNRDELYRMLRERIENCESQYLVRACAMSHIPAGLVQNMAEVFAMPESKRVVLQADQLNGIKTFTASMSFCENLDHLIPPPHFGEHTLAILQDLGL